MLMVVLEGLGYITLGNGLRDTLAGIVAGGMQEAGRTGI